MKMGSSMNLSGSGPYEVGFGITQPNLLAQEEI